jgi:ribosomal protein S18 acetylase RimI-like enzyme
MSAERKESALVRLWRQARGFVRHRWNSKEYIVYHKSLEGLERQADDLEGRFRFFVATLDDIAWMTPYLGAWARWSIGGREVSSAEPVLREQFDGEDFTVAGAENRPDGALVFILHLSRDDFSLRFLGDAFNPESDVSVRRGWVSPDHRRQGIANAGVRFAEAECARRGLKNVWNFVETRNTASQGMHDKLGYADRGRARIITRPWGRCAGLRLDPATRWRTRRIPFAISHL